MTAFHPVIPMGAIAFVETAKVPDPRRLICDHAAAGTIRTYAMVVETTAPGRLPVVVRGAAVPVELWQRIVREGAVNDVWLGGTVRLTGSELIDGRPAVDITGIGFNEASLRSLVAYHRARKVLAPTQKAKPASPREADADVQDAQRPPTAATRPVPPIAPCAILATVPQAMDALEFKRTKVNDMMKDGCLERVKVDGGTRITVASIRAVAKGRSDHRA